MLNIVKELENIKARLSAIEKGPQEPMRSDSEIELWQELQKVMSELKDNVVDVERVMKKREDGTVTLEIQYYVPG